MIGKLEIFWGTGGVGGLAAKSATKSAVKKALQSNLGKGARVSDDLVKQIISKETREQAKTRLGVYGGIGFKKADEIIEKVAPRVVHQAIQAGAVGGQIYGDFEFSSCRFPSQENLVATMVPDFWSPHVNEQVP